jgi:hypothetical protein
MSLPDPAPPDPGEPSPSRRTEAEVLRHLDQLRHRLAGLVRDNQAHLDAPKAPHDE